MKKLTIPMIYGSLSWGLLLLGLVTSCAEHAAAQDLPVPPAGGPEVGSATRGVLPSLELPGEVVSPIEPIPADMHSESVVTGDLQSEYGLFGSGEDLRIFDCQPALLESTGTWLRRGFWYSEVDVLLMDRIWRRDGFILAQQDIPTAPAPENTFGIGENALGIEGGRIGAEATPRLNVGRFLFRDHKNRDHNMEFVAFGGSQWTTSGRLDAVNGGTLNVGSYNIVQAEVGFNVVRFPLDRGNVSFDGATSTQYRYDSRFNSFELNYQLKSRMRKDRMELEPSGHWVRRAQPTMSRSLLAGIRYFNLSEDFDWDAFGIADADNDNNTETGNYRVRTDNDLIGTQLGFGWAYESARWSLGLTNKSGIYINHTDVNSAFSVTGNVTSGANNITVDNLSFITEGSVVGKWHLRPNLSLRAGVEMMFVSSVAHAIEQLNFIPVATSTATVINGDSTYMGGLIGFEGYW
ncbi:MAG: BBP7 family outer membrane beta-barrel protein [Bythopirellula sp.]